MVHYYRTVSIKYGGRQYKKDKEITKEFMKEFLKEK